MLTTLNNKLAVLKRYETRVKRHILFKIACGLLPRSGQYL